MNELMPMITALVAGFAIGALFYGGLWWTVCKGLSSPRPALWFLGGGLVRMGSGLSGFYLVGQGDWKRLAACLVGFLMARLVVTTLTRPSSETGKEAGDAP